MMTLEVETQAQPPEPAGKAHTWSGERAGTSAAMPLSMACPGQSVCVTGMVGGGQGMAQKLAAMGLLPGVRVTLLGAPCGHLLLRVGKSRYALGRGMAQRILVLPCVSSESAAASGCQ